MILAWYCAPVKKTSSVFIQKQLKLVIPLEELVQGEWFIWGELSVGFFGWQTGPADKIETKCKFYLNSAILRCACSVMSNEIS